MAHRRVKDIDYDEDDLADYSEDEYGEEQEGEAVLISRCRMRG